MTVTRHSENKVIVNLYVGFYNTKCLIWRMKVNLYKCLIGSWFQKFIHTTLKRDIFNDENSRISKVVLFRKSGIPVKLWYKKQNMELKTLILDKKKNGLDCWWSPNRKSKTPVLKIRYSESMDLQVFLWDCVSISNIAIAGKKITEGIATNPVTEPFAVSVNVPCMPWRKFCRVIL